MSILAWNCRGVGNPRTVQDLLALIKAHNPKLVFLSETLQCENRMRNLRWRLGLKNCIAVQSNNRGDGLLLYYDESLDVHLHSFSNHYIDVSVGGLSDQPWQLTCVYGEPRVERRLEMWNRLRYIKGTVNEPWLVLGDFNEAAF